MRDPEPSPELRALAERLFAAARAERPDPALGRRLLLIAPPNGTPRSSQRAPAVRSTSPSRLARWLLAALVLGGAAAVFWVERPPRIGIAPEPARIARSELERIAIAPEPERGPTPVAHGDGAPAAPPVASAPSVRDEASARSAEATAAATPPAPPSRSAQRAASPSRRAPQGPAARTAPVRDAASSSGVTSSNDATSSNVATASNDAASAGASPSATGSPPAAAESLHAELALLKRARSALRSGEGKRALALLDRHAREHASGALLDEALVLRMEALAASDQHDAARTLARRFIVDNPNSALKDRARDFLDEPAP